MQTWRTTALAGLVLLLWHAPATAMTCTQWGRIPADERQVAIERMIQDAMASQRGREFQVNRNAIERCLMRNARTIEYDFDDTCADGNSAGMSALNTLFKNYIWSCVN